MSDFENLQQQMLQALLELEALQTQENQLHRQVVNIETSLEVHYENEILYQSHRQANKQVCKTKRCLDKAKNQKTNLIQDLIQIQDLAQEVLKLQHVHQIKQVWEILNIRLVSEIKEKLLQVKQAQEQSEKAERKWIDAQIVLDQVYDQAWLQEEERLNWQHEEINRELQLIRTQIIWARHTYEGLQYQLDDL
jgi:hypothetical protein